MNNVLPQDLQVFIHAARLASFAAAAQELGASPAYISKRIAILEDSVKRKLALREFRAAMYGHQMGEERTIRVANADEEKQRRAEGFGDPPADVLLSLKWKKSVEPTPIDATGVVSTEYPKVLHHPGFLIGGSFMKSPEPGLALAALIAS